MWNVVGGGKIVLPLHAMHMTYRFELVRSKVCPFLRQKTVGSGEPLGGPHSSSTVSPCATRVFCGSRRNSSRSTKIKHQMMGYAGLFP